jgi:CheY-like chemotaxis protein
MEGNNVRNRYSDSRGETLEMDGQLSNFGPQGSSLSYVPFTVLLVEDEEAARTGMRLLLNDRDYEVVEAGCGEEALEKFENCDLVISDIRLPDMDGIETIRRIQKAEPSKEAILMTAYRHLIPKVERSGIKYRGLFSKPLEWEDVEKAVDSVRDEKRTILVLIEEISAQLKIAREEQRPDLQRHEAFLLAKQGVWSELGKVLEGSEKRKRQLAVTLAVAMKNVSFVPSLSPGLRRPNVEQIDALVFTLSKLGLTGIAETEQFECEQKLRSVGLGIDMELFDDEFFDEFDKHDIF